MKYFRKNNQPVTFRFVINWLIQLGYYFLIFLYWMMNLVCKNKLTISKAKDIVDELSNYILYFLIKHTYEQKELLKDSTEKINHNSNWLLENSYEAMNPITRCSNLLLNGKGKTWHFKNQYVSKTHFRNLPYFIKCNLCYCS